MAFPFMAALAALFSLGSAGANFAMQRKRDNARKDVLKAERIRQKGYDAEADALNLSSQDRFKDYGDKQGEKAKSLGDYFAEESVQSPLETPNAQAGSVMPSATSDIVTREINNQQGAADAFVGQQAGALGDLRSFGDLLGDTSILQARDASQIGQIGGFKRGSSAVVPYELEEANQKGAGLGLLGDILGGLGSIGMQAGGGGMGGLFGPSGVTLGAKGPAKGSFRAAQTLYPTSQYYGLR